MGSLRSTKLANLFMDFYENRWSDLFQFYDQLLYRRYIDGIIRFFNSEQDADEFFDRIQDYSGG